ncbi:MAG: hypothetical protein HY361_01130 [Candidatus Aenigmarchaeota archaeon]|nr:hypothetical protein [Candidatus Aenigmarchaeota archaeon]
MADIAKICQKHSTFSHITSAIGLRSKGNSGTRTAIQGNTIPIIGTDSNKMNFINYQTKNMEDV